MFDELYPIAVECGVDAVLFWDMTYAEIMTKVNACRKNEKQETKLKAMFIHKLGGLIGIAVNEPKKYPSTAKEAFDKMKIFDEDKEPIKQDWRIMKERMNTYANLKKRRGDSI